MTRERTLRMTRERTLRMTRERSLQMVPVIMLSLRLEILQTSTPLPHPSGNDEGHSPASTPPSAADSDELHRLDVFSAGNCPYHVHGIDEYLSSRRHPMGRTALTSARLADVHVYCSQSGKYKDSAPTIPISTLSLRVECLPGRSSSFIQ